ncbi:hypothetical protein H5410_003212, partial [Solanum commersonii]
VCPFGVGMFSLTPWISQLGNGGCQILKFHSQSTSMYSSISVYRMLGQEAEERIKLNEEKSDDKSNEKMENINQEFIIILNVVRSHKYCCLFESRLPSQEDLYYFKQIKQYMDLQIIQNKLEQDVYSNLNNASFFRDLLLILNNVIVYYPNETL